jgi:hypothetical protein
MFQTIPLSIIRSFSLYAQQWCISYRFVDILLASCPQNCMTYTTAVCAVKNSWWWTEELSETCRISFQEQIWEISASGWFYYRNLSWCMVTWSQISEYSPLKFQMEIVVVDIIFEHDFECQLYWGNFCVHTIFLPVKSKFIKLATLVSKLLFIITHKRQFCDAAMWRNVSYDHFLCCRVGCCLEEYSSRH